ncbi:Alpha/Beta hydrolase protein [Xylariomycetidae sp. FL0641]|nr:Alpha/Beta hydrolase protein [Xylariomycetidae sp. FL0641]
MSVEQTAAPSSPQPPYPLHPSVVDRIDPEYRAFYERHVAKQQQVHLQPIAASRASGTLIPGAGPPAAVARTADYAVPRRETPAGPAVRVRAFTPRGARPAGGWPACVYFHGGGWVLGTIDTENVVASHLCARGGCVVVTVDYRLAPEHPYPAAVDDCWEAVQWLLDAAGRETLGINPDKLATGGSSAGGNLAAIMCQRAAAMPPGDGRRRPRFALQLLSVPVTDNTADAGNTPSWRENQHVPALPAPKMRWYRDHYLPDAAARADPEASPLLWAGDWAQLPPAVVVVGELDVLRDEGRRFADKLRDAGVPVELHVMKGQPHPFIAMDGVLQAGREAITFFCDALKATMYPDDA